MGGGRGKASKPFDLVPGQRGILASCFKQRERQTERELLDIFTHYHGLQGELGSEAPETPLSFEEELVQLRKRPKSAPIQSISMGDIPCLVFITLPPPSPYPLTERLWKDTLAGKKPTRYCQRCLPIELTCYANMQDLSKTVEVLLGAHSDLIGPKGPFTVELSAPTVGFAVEYQSRYHSTLTKDLATEMIASTILARPAILTDPAIPPSPPDAPSYGRFCVDLSKPKLTILVQVLKNIVGLALVTDYASAYRKGNLQLMYDAFVDGHVHTARSK